VKPQEESERKTSKENGKTENLEAQPPERRPERGAYKFRGTLVAKGPLGHRSTVSMKGAEKKTEGAFDEMYGAPPLYLGGQRRKKIRKLWVFSKVESHYACPF